MEGKIGRFYDDEGWTVYRLGFRRPARRAYRRRVQRGLLRRAAEGEGAFAGLGFDLTAFQGGAPGRIWSPASGGDGLAAFAHASPARGRAWSAGVGYSSCPLRFLRSVSSRAGARCRSTARDGLELAAGLSFSFGGGGRNPRSRRRPDPRGAAAPVGRRAARPPRHRVDIARGSGWPMQSSRPRPRQWAGHTSGVEPGRTAAASTARA